MKSSQIDPIEMLKHPPAWLGAIAVGVMVTNLAILWKVGDEAHLGMSILFWLPVCSLIWERRDKLNLQSDPIGSFIGALLIGFFLFAIVPMPAKIAGRLDTYDPLLRFMPFLSGLGVALIASGIKGLKQYKSEILILFFLGIPKVIITDIIKFDISPITAKISAFVLWYTGHELQLRDSVFIDLPGGSIKVYSGCSGMESMTYLLGLAVVCLIMFPLERFNQKIHKIFITIFAVVTGFLVNVVRVSLMAILAASSKPEAFDYWHEGDGSLIFGMIAVGVFGLFYMFLLKQDEAQSQDPVES
jgi:cyanoexosortase A